jgi:PST family polysaccharide transporter
MSDDKVLSYESPENSTDSPVKAAPIGHLAIRGVIWSNLLMLAVKVISILQQLVIARFFLDQSDFGLVAMAQVVISLACIGQHLGLSEIMARRHRTFEEWAQAAIWMSLGGAALFIGIILIILPLWNPLYSAITSLITHNPLPPPQIQGLLAIWCLGIPFDAVATIFNARLRADMRFRTWAIIASIQTIGIAILSVALAFAGFGAYALVIPLPIMMAACCLLSRYYSGQRMLPQPQFRRWGALLRDARYFFGGNVFNVLLQQGDYLITGFFFPPMLLGIYYFAFRMSSQTGQLISANLATVLVPSFARLDQERGRQLAAYERTVSALLLIGIPLCALQALLAEPVFHLLFPKGNWNEAIPLFEVLSLAIGFAIPSSTALSLLIAQGRLRMNMLLTIAQASLFLCFVIAGALCGSVEWVARSVALFYVMTGPVIVSLPLVSNGVSLPRFLARIYAFPAIAAALAATAGWGIPSLLHLHNDILLLLFRAAIWAVIIGGMLILIRPPASHEVIPRAAGYLSRLLPKRMRPPSPLS